MASPDLLDLPERRGPAPRTNPTMPHQQLDQTAPADLQEALLARTAGLPGVRVGESLISVPGARAFHLEPGKATGAPEAFIRETEFAHLHPPYDGSMHLGLHEDDARVVVERGWAEFHPLVAQGVMPPTIVMVFGPRDADELETVWRILQASHANATAGVAGD